MLGIVLTVMTAFIFLLQIDVEVIYTHLLKPHPASITQKEKQLVLFQGNHYVYSPYHVVKQTTTINLGTKNVESYTKLKPVQQSDNVLNYGPFENIPPLSEVCLSYS